MKRLLKKVLPPPVADLLRVLKQRLAQKRSPAPKPVPDHLLRNQITPSRAALDCVEKSIRLNYHAGWRSEANWPSVVYENDLCDHLTGRLDSDRAMVIPWLDAARPLSGQRILEIGCGTGSSTVALAEQGAGIIGIDVDDGALRVARDRCSAYGLSAEFRELNAENILRGVWYPVL